MRDERDEHEEARRLLTPLVGEPAAPSSVDIRRAIADGRRHLRTRRLTGVGAVAAVTALLVAGVPMVVDAARGAGDRPPAADPATTEVVSPSPPSAPALPTECELELLPMPAGSEKSTSVVAAGDPTGRFLAGRSYEVADPGQQQVLIWDHGEPVQVDVPGFDPRVEDVNSRGVAVGTTFESSDSGSGASWSYVDGQVVMLAGEDTWAQAINEQGNIVGSRGEPGERLFPVIWRDPTAPIEELSVPGPTWSIEATDVDSDGTVVGTGYRDDEIPLPPDHSFVWWPDGTREELPWPIIDGEPAGGFRAESIRDGVVTGLVTDLDVGRSVRLFHYDLRAGEFTDLSGAAPIYPDAWNSHGWLAGSGSGDRPGLWSSSGGLVPLPGLDRPGAHERYYDAVVTLSEDGRVVGALTNDGQRQRGGVWRCH